MLSRGFPVDNELIININNTCQRFALLRYTWSRENEGTERDAPSPGSPGFGIFKFHLSYFRHCPISLDVLTRHPWR